MRLKNDMERRILAHLPRWRNAKDLAAAEKSMREVNGFPEDWSFRVSRTFIELSTVLKADNSSPYTLDEIDETLEDLRARGFVELKHGEFTETKTGYEALHQLSEEEQTAENARIEAGIVEPVTIGGTK